MNTSRSMPQSSWTAAAGAGAVCAVALVAGFFSYREWIHGPFLSFAVAMLLALVSAMLVAAMCLARRLPAWLTVIGVLCAAVPAPVVHTARILNRHTPLQQSVTSWLDYGAVVEPTLKGEASIKPGVEELTLRVPAESIGYLELRAPLPHLETWKLPRALFVPEHRRVGEELSWRASVDLDHAYFVLVEADRVLVQMAAWGLLITQPGPRGDSQGQGVPFVHQQGAWHDWSLRRSAGRLALLAGGRELWSMPDPEPFRVLRLGETRTDREHGGTLRLRALRFRRFVT